MNESKEELQAEKLEPPRAESPNRVSARRTGRTSAASINEERNRMGESNQKIAAEYEGKSPRINLKADSDEKNGRITNVSFQDLQEQSPVDEQKLDEAQKNGSNKYNYDSNRASV